ncbi:MAG TPA: VIT1/CCC1 transporter family protein [Acidimicrobiales bacterium]|nr:VIT1/CCC1 transporter family protein [Acidimicrobiales bacterium]
MARSLPRGDERGPERVRRRRPVSEAHADHHHRDVRGGAARAAVFGVSDGLVSNVSLILGVAGAHPSAGVVRLAGLAGLVAGACSMAAGEFVSMRAQSELLQRELEVERREIARHPHSEQRELARIYERRGLDAQAADEMAAHMMRDPDTALETHAREELGIDPRELGSPLQAATASFLAFSLGAVAPLMPWFFTSSTAAVVASVVIGAVMAVLVGLALSAFTGRSPGRTVLRQLVVSSGAAAITYGIGSLVGVSGIS